MCDVRCGLVSFETNVSETAGQIHLSDNVRCKGHSVSFAFKTQIEICLIIKHV